MKPERIIYEAKPPIGYLRALKKNILTYLMESGGSVSESEFLDKGGYSAVGRVGIALEDLKKTGEIVIYTTEGGEVVIALAKSSSRRKMAS